MYFHSGSPDEPSLRSDSWSTHRQLVCGNLEPKWPRSVVVVFVLVGVLVGVVVVVVVVVVVWNEIKSACPQHLKVHLS